MDFDRFLDLMRALDAERVEYVLFGAMAIAAHGFIRATEDVDLFLRPAPDNIAACRRALSRVWDDPHIEEITADDLCGGYPAVSYGPPDEGFSIDLVTRLGTAWAYDDLEWEILEFEGVPTRVATPRTLYEMKRDTIRPKDRIDADALRRKFNLED